MQSGKSKLCSKTDDEGGLSSGEQDNAALHNLLPICVALFLWVAIL